MLFQFVLMRRWNAIELILSAIIMGESSPRHEYRFGVGWLLK